MTAQRHNRDELAELLYGGQDRARGRANLRQSLSYLRNAISKNRLGADRLNVWLPCDEDVSIDVTEYQHLLKSGETADRQSDLSATAGHLAKAVDLYRGEFLSGFFLKDSFPFEEWQLMVHENLRRRQASALRQLLEIHGVWGQYEQAIDYGRRWLSLDPLEEAVHRRLMELCSLAGRPTEALRQYERCRSVLEHELGEQPEEETEWLRDQINARKLLFGTGRRRKPLRDAAALLRQKPSVRNLLFLFVQMTAVGAEQVIQQETRLRESVGKERGRIFTATERMLYAAFPLPEAAARVALDAQIRTQGIEGGLRIVLLAGEHGQHMVPSAHLVERAGMFLEILHAGQILLNETAAKLVDGTHLPEGATLRCLGSHRLKDLGPAQPLQLLEHPNLPQGLPQPETLDSRPNNLQTQTTRFIGREVELASAQGTLRLEGVRLLTITGAGGAGKTRLALRAAAGLYDLFEQGIFFVDLAAVNEPSHVAGAIAAVLNVREAGGDGRLLPETMKDYIASKRMLLLLDNFEHVLSAAPLVTEFLMSCPQLKILATSREALHLQTERVMRVPPMQLPSHGQSEEAMKRCEAVRLFAERAAAVLSTFELSDDNVHMVAKICSRLDGLPLAIELAATRLNVLTPQTLLRKLNNRLVLLNGGPRDLPQRQQTLRSEIDWSHELLDAGERRVFMRLSVFPAGCTFEAAEAVCREDTDVFANLSSLAEKNLVSLVDAKGESRFRMLETIRDYAREKLEESGEVDSIEPLFADYFLRFAEAAEPELYGPNQIEWFERIEDEYGNIREALSLLYARGELADGLRLAGALGWFWFRRGRFTEGQHWLGLFHGAAGEATPPGYRAKAAYFLGWLKLCAGNAFWGNPEGKRFFRESLRLWSEVGDLRGIALSQVWLGWKDEMEGEEDWAIVDESVEIARKTGDSWTIAWCLMFAHAHLKRPDMDLSRKRSALEEVIALAQKTEDPFLLSQALSGMGHVHSWSGELEAAEPWYTDSLRIAREIDDSWSILSNINCLADGCLGLGRFRRAQELYTDGLGLAIDLGAKGFFAWFIGGFYSLARRQGRTKRAVRLGAFSESILNPESRYNSHFAEELGLDDEVAAAEWKIGQAMSPEQAVAYVLSDE